MAYTSSVKSPMGQLLTESQKSEMIAKINRTRKDLKRHALCVVAMYIVFGTNIPIILKNSFDAHTRNEVFMCTIIAFLLTAVTLFNAHDYVAALTIYEPSRKFDSAREHMQYEESSSKRILDSFRWLA